MRSRIGISETVAPLPAKLLICIVKNNHQVEEILTGFLELGLRGATVVDGRGMEQILSTQVPIFRGLRSMLPGGSAGTHVILSVVQHGLVSDAMRLAEEICGDLDKAGAGFVLTLPVRRVHGMANAIR